MMELLWLLLPVAAASGWWIAKRDPIEQVGNRDSSAEYFRGLNYLLDDKPDQAIEVFIRMVDVDPDTAETHMVLGNLFRRRGEVDRAIHIHSSLIARNSLTARQRSRALLELGEDYMSAGLFDRAETLFRELVDRTEHAAVSLSRLIGIYEQEKDWAQAIIHCDRLEQLTGQTREVEVSHFFCELAEEAQIRGDESEADSFLQRALKRNSNCARASIVRGQIALAKGRFEAAVGAFQAVERQDRVFFSEVLDALKQCYQALDRPADLVSYLRLVQAENHTGHVTAAFAEILKQHEGEQAALEFLETELKEYPTFLGLRSFVELKLAQENDSGRSDLETLYRMSRQILKGAVFHRCDNCGFSARSLHWRCPRCKRWNTVKPLPDLSYGDGV